MIIVVAALIQKDNKILIAKRSTGDQHILGKWEFPGGKVEPNETEERAIEREIEEEFELKIKAKEFITNSICEYPHRTIDLRLYACDYISGDFKLHDHSEFRWVSKDEILDYDLAPADIPLAKFIIKAYNEGSLDYNPKIEDLIIGKAYTNNEIANTFKCSNMGGMRRSRETNSLVLIAKHNNPLYDDQWTADGILNYTGMGTTGNQSVLFAQNKVLANAKQEGIKVFLFESYKDNEYYYDGEVEVVGPIFRSSERDAEGTLREVIKFPLRKLNDTDIIIDLNSVVQSEEDKIKEVQKHSPEEIKEKAKEAECKTVPSKEVKTIYRERNQYIVEFTKNRAKGICDLCGKEAPFKDKKGNHYLEAHHVVTLAEGGPDAIYNTVAICPNCHRQIHILRKNEDMKKLQKAIFNYLQIDDDKENLIKFKSLFKYPND